MNLLEYVQSLGSDISLEEKIALTKSLKRTEWVEVDLSKKDDKSQASIQ